MGCQSHRPGCRLDQPPAPSACPPDHKVHMVVGGGRSRDVADTGYATVTAFKTYADRGVTASIPSWPTANRRDESSEVWCSNSRWWGRGRGRGGPTPPSGRRVGLGQRPPMYATGPGPRPSWRRSCPNYPQPRWGLGGCVPARSPAAVDPQSLTLTQGRRPCLLLTSPLLGSSQVHDRAGPALSFALAVVPGGPKIGSG